MTSRSCLLQSAALCVVGILVLSILVPSRASAGIVFGVDVQNYVVMYQGGSSGSQLSINNFGTTGVWTGDIGIAGTGKLAASGPGTVNGNINFAAPDTGQASISNTTINGTVNYGVPSVQVIMNSLNTLSTNFGANGGASLAINTSSDQTVLATSGTLIGGNRFFSVTSVSSGNGQNLIVRGDGSQGVIFNVNTPGDAQFHGNILLQDLTGKFLGDSGYAGLVPDQVLFNLYAADKLDANNNGNSAHPANIIEATFLDPDGAISMVNTRFVGRVFGGDSTNMQIVSGDTIAQGPAAPTPEPTSIAAWGLLGLCGLAVRRWRS